MGMSIDEIFSEVGELGRQQFKFITLINILHIYFPFYMLQYSFVARNVDFYCNVPPSQYSDNVSIPQLLLNQSTTEGMSYNILARMILNDIIHDSTWAHCLSQKICDSLLGVQTGGGLLNGVEKKITESSRFKYCPATDQDKCSYVFILQVSFLIKGIII